MKNTLKALMLGTALAGTLCTGAIAQTILKFSHTDNPGGSRQAAAEVFAEKVA